MDMFDYIKNYMRTADTTDYLIAGANSGNKSQKASKLGVTILSEDEWITLLS